MRLTTDDLGTYIVLPHSFTAVRVMGERLSPMSVDLEISLLVDASSGTDTDSIGQKAGIGFRKIRTWLELVLPEIVIVNGESDLADTISEQTDNLVMITPDEPDDVILAALLLSKLQAITEGQLVVAQIAVSSSDTGFIKRIMKPDAIRLPGIEYLGEEAVHDKPWWQRDTIETADFPKTDATEEYFAEISVRDPLKEIEREFYENDEEADVISIDAWKAAKPH